jgi:uncharacterized zinc-type alcohol dehydrogenase-like protein
VLGVGGMGQMAILIARAMGNNVVAFSSQNDKEDLIHELGGEFCNINDQRRRAQFAGKCNIILDTRTNEHQVRDTLDICANSGIIVELSMQYTTHKLNHMALFGQRKSVSGSVLGSMTSLQELLDLAAAKKIRPNVTTIRAD